MGNHNQVTIMHTRQGAMVLTHLYLTEPARISDGQNPTIFLRFFMQMMPNMKIRKLIKSSSARKPEYTPMKRLNFKRPL